jgi:tetratricopeptide (TPR) repeat protein
MTAAAVTLPAEAARRMLADWIAAGRLDHASALLAALEAARPDDPDLAVLRADLLLRGNQPDRAARLAQQAAAGGTGEVARLRILFAALSRLGRDAAALAAAERMTELAPESNEPLGLLAAARRRRLDLDGAVAACHAALARDPRDGTAHDLLADVLLLRGEYAAGWPEYAWRFRLPDLAPMAVPVPRWDGGALPAGRLLLVGDQGFGDVIQFARYLPWVGTRAAARDIVFACPTPLHALLRPLLEAALPGAALVARGAPTPGVLASLPLSLLPLLAGTRLDTIPAPGAYLRADPVVAARWRARLDRELPGRGLRRIGLVWAGNPGYGNDANRSIPLAHLAPLTGIAGIALVALQKGEAAAQLQAYSGRAPLVALGAELVDFGDTAGVLANLDLLVTIDSAPAHLSGAMGVPTLLMLPHAPDWRWLLGRADSPWYPSFRLFRQPAPGAWDQVVAAVAAALQGAGNPK